jgi:SAM-dependent methyltransferase
MDAFLTGTDRKKIYKAIHRKYKKVAKNPTGLFKYPTGRAGLEALQYPSKLINALPEAVTDSYCGVGNPFALGPIDQGEAVLDIGCGSGVDAIFTAMITGPSGKVVGIDLTPEMLKRAKENLSLTELKNITFEEAGADNLPFADQNFDVVISNGALNLVPDKSMALSEVFRVLKPGGRLMLADQILIGELPKEKKQIIKSWSR